MINSLIKGVTNIFGNKTDKDLKTLRPIVDLVSAEYDKLSDLTNDQLRNKTVEFKQRMDNFLKDVDDAIAEQRKIIKEAAYEEIDQKEAAYDEIELLEKKRDEEVEKFLDQLLPEAFAVVKETARRFTEENEVIASATDLDRDLATEKDYIDIKLNDAVYQTSWEAAGYTVEWNMIHYDVQLIGGAVLHQGKIAEMATGEGKTLVSTLPAYLNALAGRGVHIVTVNDYLARRDCEWNQPIYNFLGITVDCIDYYRPHSEERRKAYRADITYGTNNEFGFDYLRDNMSHSPNDLVQRKHHYAMIDEVDSVLIDDARTPLIISGPVPRGDIHEYNELKPRIQKLVDAQRTYLNGALLEAKRLIKEGKTSEKDGGLLLFRAQRGLPKNKALIKYLGEQGIRAIMNKAENFYLQDKEKEMYRVDEELYFTIDEKNNQINLTDKGIDLITNSGEDEDFFILPDVGAAIADLENQNLSDEETANKKENLMRDFSIKSERIHSVNQLLKAYTLFERDIEYIVQEDKVKIVDEQTGRVMDGRRYSDGLHQAIEAKENVKVEAATQTYATVTLQNFFRMYHKLSGMTGTAETEAGEFWEIYKLDVVVIPTNRPIIRDDREDLVYKTSIEKYQAVIEEIQRLSGAGRPVLVGTTSVEVSEKLSKLLSRRKLKHNVLNAKQHQRESEIVAEAGMAGSVTIATNMAGRGTDIKLGKGVYEAGGLAIVGTERHDSRRVDRQLRGRAGRQGDPGSSQFYVSLEDNLMRLFGSDRVSKVMDRFGYEEGEVIQHSMITKSIERSQKKVEQNNFGIRKRLLEYDDVMNKQRVVIYARRKNALYGERLAVDINNALYDWCEEYVSAFHATGDFKGFKLETLRMLATEPKYDESFFTGNKVEAVVQRTFEDLNAAYLRKNEHLIQNALPVLQNVKSDSSNQAENVSIPITDGKQGINVTVNLDKAIESGGQEIINAIERFTVLATVDEHWKEHLRELDDLKQSANNASYEQKDPLLIYKLESFNLFQIMISKMNTEILSMLFRGNLPGANPNIQRASDTRRRNPDLDRMETSRRDDQALAAQNRQVAAGASAPKESSAPVRVGEKVGRNDPCPCGSGKKYKKCHGKNA